jgi:hypothetical protein
MSSPQEKEILYDFFSERVEDADHSQGTELSTDAIRYLTVLLVQLGKTEALFRTTQPETLVEMHMQAAQLPRNAALGIYKHMGDFALYIGGYFSESLQRKVVDVTYYADMGGAAYHQVAGLSGTLPMPNNPLHSLFTELGDRFRECLSILMDVSTKSRTGSNVDVVMLYERWLTTRDPLTQQRLVELGVLPQTPIEG